MKSKEDLRSVMAEAIAIILAISPDHAENAAEAALKALCGALPDAYGDLVNGEETNARFYNQLKQWGK